MAYVVDRVVVCDAFREPDKHYQLLPGGRSKLVAERRPSMRFLASAKDAKGCATTIIVAGRRQLGWPVFNLDRSHGVARRR
jgi:hypothetical protein